jgi:hypothetical protein
LVARLPYANQTKIDAIGHFTGQIGYAWNNVLLYAKGGAAVTDNFFTATPRAAPARPFHGLGYVLQHHVPPQEPSARWAGRTAGSRRRTVKLGAGGAA